MVWITCFAQAGYLRRRLLRITASQKVHVLGFLQTLLFYAQFKSGMFSSDREQKTGCITDTRSLRNAFA